MLSEPRAISFLTELIHLPTKHSPEALRAIYNKICANSDYENFIRTPDGARIERRGEGADSSTVTFRGDRLVVVEDNTTLTLDQYCRKLETVATTVMEGLNLPFFLAQQATTRAIASPNAFKTGSEFLARRLFSVLPQQLEPLGRPTNLFGFRLFFPATGELPHQFNVRIENYVKDTRSIYIENVGVFKTPIQRQDGITRIGANVRVTVDFVSNEICRFLSQFNATE